MAKYYKNRKTGAVITEAEYQDLMAQQEMNMENEMGAGSMFSLGNVMNEAFEEAENNYTDYIPWEEGNERE